MSRAKVGILISGRGSNMEALIRAAADPAYPGEIALVISNNLEASGLTIAAKAGVPTLAIDHRPYGKDRLAHEQAIDAALRGAGVEFVALAGYMRVLSPWLVEAWAGRMINIHPSLLPDFPGLHTHARALAAGVPRHGCSVHLVTSGVDEGPILGQAEIEVLASDDEHSLGLRVLAEEHRLYPQCLARLVTLKNDVRQAAPTSKQ
ncbi:phosphoribosylglycinamide formyltransferase [soil metagenome]